MADVKNFSYSGIVAVPAPPLTGISIGVAPGDGALFALNRPAVIYPLAQFPRADNAEIVMVTAIAGDTLTVTRAIEGSTPRAVQLGDQIAQVLTAAMWNSLLVGTVVSSISGTPGEIVVSTPTGDVVISLPNVNPTPGTFGSSTLIPVITVDAKGRLTLVGTAPLAIGGAVSAETLTGAFLAPNVLSASLNFITPDGGTLTIQGDLTANNLSGTNTGDNSPNTLYASVAADAAADATAKANAARDAAITAAALDATAKANAAQAASQPLDQDLTDIAAIATLPFGRGFLALADQAAAQAYIGALTGGVTSVGATAPVVSSGGAAPVISMAAATSLVDGYLTAASFNVFSGKQPAGNYLTGLSGDVTAAGPGVGVATLANTTVVAGTYGDSTNVPRIVVDSKGRITGVTTQPVAGGGGGAVGANPTALVGLTAINGVAATFMRSDAAPAIDQGILPFWTKTHRWVGGAANISLILDSNAGFDRRLYFLTAGIGRWYLGVSSTAEGGSNLGSNFAIGRYDDAGTYLGDALTINRSSGGVTSFGALVVNNTLTVTGAATSLVNLSLTGIIVSTRDNAFLEVTPVTPSAGSWFRIINTAGAYYVGSDFSNASAFAMAGNYGMVLSRPSGVGFAIGRGSTSDLFISGTGAATFASTIGATNFSGTHSGNSSGTNTGDQNLAPYALLTGANFSGNITAPNLSGTNTGDQTTISGQAGNTMKFMSTSHNGTYWLENNWDGARWFITSNHGAPVRVGRADVAGTIDGQANSATITASVANTPNQIVLRDGAGNINAQGAGFSGPISAAGMTSIVADTAAGLFVKGVTGMFRVIPYFDATFGVLLESTNAAGNSPIPLTFVGTVIRQRIAGVDITTVSGAGLTVTGNLGVTGTITANTQFRTSAVNGIVVGDTGGTGYITFGTHATPTLNWILGGEASANRLVAYRGVYGNAVVRFALTDASLTLSMAGATSPIVIGANGVHGQLQFGANTRIFGGSDANMYYDVDTAGGAGTHRFRISGVGDRVVMDGGTTTVFGNLTVTSTLSKASGTFRIDHPLPAKKATHYLVHSFVEAPRADLIYRGTVTLASGVATVDLDVAAGWTPGTWDVLCRDPMAFVQNVSGFSPLRASIAGHILTIASLANQNFVVNWMVVAERKDDAIKQADWTDLDGHTVLEPEKVVDEFTGLVRPFRIVKPIINP